MYTDGTTSTARLTLSDWTLDGGKATPATGDSIAAKMSYRNVSTNKSQSVATYVFAATIPIVSGETVASITLPASVTLGRIGLFAITSG